MSDSVTLAALTGALDALAQRQRVIANNTANIQTPGYTAQRVNFEDALAAQLNALSDPTGTDTGLDTGALTSLTTTTDPARPDGNNVNLDSETLLGVDTNLRYQLMLRAVDNKISSLRDVLRSA